MALRTQQFTVATTAVELRPTGAPTTADFGTRAKMRITAAPAADLYIGPSGVTTSNGFKVPQGTTVELTLNPTERIYGIAGTSGTVCVLRQDY